MLSSTTIYVWTMIHNAVMCAWTHKDDYRECQRGPLDSRNTVKKLQETVYIS